MHTYLYAVHYKDHRNIPIEGRELVYVHPIPLKVPILCMHSVCRNELILAQCCIPIMVWHSRH